MAMEGGRRERERRGAPGQAQVLDLIPRTGVDRCPWRKFLFSNFITYIFILTYIEKIELLPKMRLK